MPIDMQSAKVNSETSTKNLEAENNEPLVSIVIPTYNRADMAVTCIESVFANDYKNIEVILVDNASTDDTVIKVKEKFGDREQFRLKVLCENMMAAGGRNAGLAVSKGEYILFLDSDNELYHDTISNLVLAFKERKDVDYIGLMSINAQRNNTIWLLSAGYNWITSKGENKGENLEVGSTKLQRFYDTYYVPNAFAVTRKAIKKVGGFDEQYYIMFEEADFGYRIAKAGMKAVVCTDVKTHHLGYVAKDDDPKIRNLGIGEPKRAYHFAKNRFIFMKKFAPWYGRLVFDLVFSHVFTVYYSHVASKCGRKDIAKAYIKGARKGRKIKVTKDIFIKYQ